MNSLRNISLCKAEDHGDWDRVNFIAIIGVKLAGTVDIKAARCKAVFYIYDS